MPTIFVIGAFRIMINTADHGPPHVHCVGPGCVVIVEIQSRSIIRNKGVLLPDVRRLLKVIKEKEDVLMNEWSIYHAKEE